MPELNRSPSQEECQNALETTLKFLELIVSGNIGQSLDRLNLPIPTPKGKVLKVTCPTAGFAIEVYDGFRDGEFVGDALKKVEATTIEEFREVVQGTDFDAEK